MYGINIDEEIGGNEFEYLIAEDYSKEKEGMEGCVVKTIPKFTWAIFPCHGPGLSTIQEINKKIFSEWFPEVWIPVKKNYLINKVEKYIVDVK